MSGKNLDTIVNIAVPAAGAWVGYTWAGSLTEMVPMIAPVQPWLSVGLGLWAGMLLAPKVEGLLSRAQ